MIRNGARRTALLDAAIEVVARHGERGLTLRAVDADAAVPPGTTSNYFRSRADLLRQAIGRVRVRLGADLATLTAAQSSVHDRARLTAHLQTIVERGQDDPAPRVAALELALAAARDPELRPTGWCGPSTAAATPEHDEVDTAVVTVTLGLLVGELAVPELSPPADALITDLADTIDGGAARDPEAPDTRPTDQTR